MKASTSKSSVITQILLAVVAIALGYLLLFNTTVQVTTLCQILCGGIIAVGVASIASFFLAGDYKRIDRYGFALGTLLILVGFIGLIRIKDVTGNFEIYTGMMSLILGVLVLQGTVQMKILDYPVWILNLVISLICIVGAVAVLTGFNLVTDKVAGFPSWVLLIAGIASLFSMFVTFICIKLAARREKKIQAEQEAAAEREAQARKEAEEQAKREEQARKEAEAQARRQAEEQARREAEAKALREEQARKAAEEQAQKEVEAAAQREALAQKEAAAKAAAEAEAQNSFPPVESPELVFGGDDAGQTDIQ